MHNQEINQILSDWYSEFSESLSKTNVLCIALFGADKKLLFTSPHMNELFVGEPHESLINPTFDKLMLLKNDSSLVYEGLLTIGSNFSVNTSIVAQVFLKEGKMLIIGGVDIAQLLEQNKTMHHLNNQINNLQRQLLKEKSTLENTLIQLNDTNSALEQANIAKDKIFSIIAHDLKSPFISIIGFSDLLMEKVNVVDIQGINRYAQIIVQSSQKAMDLLMNLMEWSQSQTGRIDFNPELLKLGECISETVLLFDSIAGQKSITFKKVLPLNLLILADKAMISTVFRNLIANAIKFTMPGGEITISAIERDNEIIFSISDTGVGISPKNIDKLFRIDKSFSTVGTNNEKGSGLGLILCKEFVEKHNGRIWIESEEGKGTIFYFSLPDHNQPNKMKITE